MNKAELRQHIAASLPDVQTLELLSTQIVKNIQRLELFQTAKTIGAYMPLPDEVDIRPLFQGLEKPFYIPTFDKDSGGYRLAKSDGELKKGKFGILEPANPIFAPRTLDLILVPGVAFDRAGCRIGRGGGFYDRLLPLYRAVRVGICFEFQCVEDIPVEPHDCSVDRVISHIVNS